MNKNPYAAAVNRIIRILLLAALVCSALTLPVSA